MDSYPKIILLPLISSTDLTITVPNYKLVFQLFIPVIILTAFLTRTTAKLKFAELANCVDIDEHASFEKVSMLLF